MEEKEQPSPVTDNPFSFKHFLKKYDDSNSTNDLITSDGGKDGTNSTTTTTTDQPTCSDGCDVIDDIPFPDVQHDKHSGGKKTKGKKVRNVNKSQDLLEEQNENPFSFKNFVKKDAALKSTGRVLQIVDDEVHEVLTEHDNSGHTTKTLKNIGHNVNADKMNDVALKVSDSQELYAQDAITKLEDENKKLKRELEEAKQAKENESKKVTSLLKKLKDLEQKENEETAALEKMVHMVEKNLELTTQRAVKAEALAAKLREENKLLKGASVSKVTYDELVSEHYNSLANIKQQANSAAEQLNTTAMKAEESLKQLYAGVDSFKLVSELLKSIDKFSTISKDDPPSQ